MTDNDESAKADLAIARLNMLKQQFRTWDIVNIKTLNLFEEIHRENFVPKPYVHLAYADLRIPLGHDQFMFTPREEAKIIDKLQITRHERVWEIGTGSGFFTALLAQLAKHVDSIDIFEDFIETAEQKLKTHNMFNVALDVRDAVVELSKKSMNYDVIVITSSMSTLPKHLLSRLNKGGRLFVIIGKEPLMQAKLITKHSENHIKTEILFETISQPMINYHSHEKFIF